MPNLRAKAAWIATIAVAAVAAAGPASATGLPIAMRSLDGAWTGHLEYRDYQTDAWTTIPATLTCKVAADGASLLRHLVFRDPGRTVLSKDVVLVDEAAGKLFGITLADARPRTDAYDIVEASIDGPTAWHIVLETSGRDAGRSARLRITQHLEDGVLTSRQDVRYTDADADGTWRERNRTRFTRPAPAPDELVGTWRVDLRPTPDAAPSFQAFRVDAVEEGRLRGAFYDTPIEHGRINVDWGVLRFAFTTSDGSGVYHTSGVLENGRLRGTTHAVGRGFLSVWTAERTDG